MKSLLIVFTLFLTVNLFSQNETVETPKIAIKVTFGNTIQLKNHSVKFLKVLEDSRCPEYVNCIWAGRARVLVEVNNESNKLIQKELLFGQTKPGEIIDNSLFTTKKSIINGLTLLPNPNSEVKTEDKSYYLLLEVNKL